MAYNDLPLEKGLTPSHVESAEADAFILGSDLLRENPFQLNTYFRQGGREMTTLQKLAVFGFGSAQQRASYSPTTSHWEKPRESKIFNVGAIEAGAEANEAIITLTEADMVTTVNEYGQVFVQSRPRVTETVQFVAGGHTYWIIEKDTTSNPHKITVKADTDDFDPMDEIVEGSIGDLQAPVKGEGTGQIKPLRPRRYKYQNTFWITDDTEAVTGSNLTTQVRFDVIPGSKLLWMEGLRDMEKRHERNKGYVWMFGHKIDPNNWVMQSEFLDEEVQIPGTQGLIKFIQEGGVEFYYDPADFGFEDMRALANYFNDINLGTSDVLLLQGINANQAIEESYSAKMNYNWVIGVSDKYIKESTRVNWGKGLDREYDPTGAFVNMNITGFAESQFTFMQTACPEFNDAKGPGAIGYKDWMIAAPFGLANVEGNDYRPYLGYEYRGADGYNRENEVWTVGGAGNRAITGRSDWNKTSPLDGVSFYVRSEIAPHFSLAEQFALYRPSTGSSS